MSSELTIDDSLKDVLCLLVMYPLDSLILNPWEVAQIFYKYKKSQKLRGDLTQAEDLPTLFQLFSVAFGVRTDRLAQYFASFFTTNSNGQSVMHENVTAALASPVLNALLSYKSIKMLASNGDLIKWEFVRYLSYQKSNTPFLEDLVLPLPCQRDFTILGGSEMTSYSSPCSFVISEASVLNWAIGVPKISLGNAQSVLSETRALINPTGQGQDKGLTFSAFIIFALRCFHCQHYGISAQGRFVDSGEAEVTVRLLLETLSVRLTKVQQKMKLKVLLPLLSKGGTKASLLGKLEQDVLFSLCINLFEKVTAPKISDKWSFLPPRPPPVFWDAPKVVDFLRFVGVVERSGSVSTSWIAYGSQLMRSQGGNSGWGTYVVPPSPIKLDVSALACILSTVCQMCCEEDTNWILVKEETGNDEIALLELFGSYLCDTILPLVTSYVEKGHMSQPSQYVDYQLPIGDLLRYGGARAMSSLFGAGIWLERSYEHLCAFMQDESLSTVQMEPDVTLSVKFFSCFGLLKPRIVAVQAKRSLHSRIRFNRRVSEPRSDTLTLSFPEFEELFLRSALCIWASNGESRVWGDEEEEEEPSEIMQFYLDECDRVSKASNEPTIGKTWGVDFVAAYASTLQYLMLAGGEHAEAGAGMFESLPAYLGIKTDTFLKHFSSVRSYNVEAEDRVDRSRLTVPSKSPNSPIKPTSPMGSIQALLETETVQSKAGALLKDILDSRSSSPRVAADIPQNDESFDESVMDSSIDTSKLSITSPTQSLLLGTKEALWPVYGTYCSCGDSVDPGKLSGPNLFALLAKLGVLTDHTLLSDIGILLHQISAHTHSSSVSIASATSSETFESPSLSFEEFLVFLCAFAQLRFDGKVSAPILSGNNSYTEQLSSANSQNTEVWFQNWKTFMGSNQSFRRLMEGLILPMLRRHPLLAYPQDARHRDKYSPVFSLEVLLAVEGSEEQLTEIFLSQVNSDEGCCDVDGAKSILEGIGLMPNVVSSDEVVQLFRDVAPEVRLSRSSSPSSPSSSSLQGKESSSGSAAMNFPQFEWVVCVVAFQAVERAIADCPVPTPQNKISRLVRDFIISIAKNAHTAMMNIK